MPSKRVIRSRGWRPNLSPYQTYELLTGDIVYPMKWYTGYGDGHGKDLTAFISDVMRHDWQVHRDWLLAFWISASFPRRSLIRIGNRGCFFAVLRGRDRGPGGNWRITPRLATTSTRTTTLPAAACGYRASARHSSARAGGETLVCPMLNRHWSKRAAA